ncbi:unnamed protein product [Dicrocoelium dendriticum]|nr:unnamed protein product [Dicrocoelium dendriticum]
MQRAVMGGRLTVPDTKLIHLNINGQSHTIRISRFSSDQEVRHSNVTVKNKSGHFIPCSGSMAENTHDNEYTVNVTVLEGTEELKLMRHVLETLTSQIHE